MAAVKAVHANIGRSRLSTLSNPVLGKSTPSHTKQNRRTRAGKSLITVIALLAMLSLTCTFGGLIPNAPTSGELTGPILGMVPGISLDKNGLMANSKFTFAPTDPQITVVVQVGKVSGSPLVITWYQETEAGDQKLFEHTVDVAAYDQAYSIGKNPGLLEAGTYKVTAVLEGQTEEMEFDVSPQPASALPGAALVSTHQSASPRVSTQQGAPPVDGGSGKVAAPGSSQSSPSSSGCGAELFNFSGSNESTVADRVDVIMESTCPGFYQLMATAGGAPLQVGALNGSGRVYFGVDPCGIPGGKDLPGTKIQFDAGPQTFHYTDAGFQPGPFVITLGDDTLPPRVLLSPPNGTRVNPAQKINITVTAQEKRRNGPWQTGVKVIHVSETQVNGRNEFFTWSNPSGLPKACNAKTWEHTEHTSYRVPQNPPPFIEICASADDWYKSGAETCYQYPTGHTWKGKVHVVSSEDFNGYFCNNETWDANFQIAVAPVTGEVLGKGSANLTAPPNCRLPDPSHPCINATQAEFDVGGTFDGTQFRLTFSETAIDGSTCGLSNYTFFLDPLPAGQSRTPPDFTVPVLSFGDAEGQASNSVSTTSNTHATGQFTFTLLCQDCK